MVDPFSTERRAQAAHMSSRPSDTWRTLARQPSSKTRSHFTACLRTLWRTSWPRRRRSVCCPTKNWNGRPKMRSALWLCGQAFGGGASGHLTSTSAIGRLVDELAHQGHLLARHKEGLKCNACNVRVQCRQTVPLLEENTVCVLRR